MSPLSPEMQRCLEFVRRHGDQISRHPGGFWSTQDFTAYQGGGGSARSFGTSTVEALVRRHYLAYDRWQDGRHSKFPIRAVRLPEKGEAA